MPSGVNHNCDVIFPDKNRRIKVIGGVGIPECQIQVLCSQHCEIVAKTP